MADFFQTSRRWLAGVFAEHVSQPATYCNGNAIQISIRATIGQTTTQLDLEESLSHKFKTTDFIIPVEDLAYQGKFLEPAVGASIKWNGAVYELHSEDDEPVWRWNDPYHNAVRIHTKLI